MGAKRWKDRRLVAGCLLSLGVGTLVGHAIPSAHALSCVEIEVWKFGLESVEGPDAETDVLWEGGVNLNAREGYLWVWGRDPQTGFGADQLFEGASE